MSRIDEVLLLKTDEERIAWYWSLTEEERDEISNEMVAMETKLLAVWKTIEPSTAFFVERMGAFFESLTEIGLALEEAFNEYARK